MLPVGGIKEKVLAARRAGITCVVLPEKNETDVEEIKDEAVEGLEVHYVKRIPEALDLLLEPTAEEDPAELFSLSDREKQLAGSPSTGGPIVVTNGDPEEPVMN